MDAVTVVIILFYDSSDLVFSVDRAVQTSFIYLYTSLRFSYKSD